MALSWDDTLPAGGQATYSYMAGFSPSGDIPPNPLTPEPLPPDEPPPGTPEEPQPSPAPRPPSQASTITVPDTVFTGPNARAAGIQVRCRAIGSDRPRACTIETRVGPRRRVFVLGPRGIAKLNCASPPPNAPGCAATARRRRPPAPSSTSRPASAPASSGASCACCALGPGRTSPDSRHRRAAPWRAARPPRTTA